MKKLVVLAALAFVGAGQVASTGFSKDTVEPAIAPVAPSARLITTQEYLNTVKAIFGPSLKYPEQFAPIKRVAGLETVGTGSAIVTSGALDQFDSAARSIAAQAVDASRRDFLLPCKPKAENAPDDACAGAFLGGVAHQLFRRPITKDELKVYVGFANQASVRLKDFYSGLSATLAGLLVAPEFLYATQPVEVVRGQAKLTAHAKASRLSLLLWNAYPDEELVTAADKGELDSEKGLQRQVDRMIASPRFADGVRNFFYDMLFFESFKTLAKDNTIYPAFTQKVASDAEEQTIRTMVAHVVDDNADYRDLFTTRKTFITNDLGSVYGIPVKQPEGWAPYEFPADSARLGILTQASFLALYSHPGRTSPTKRGKAIREIFLCQKVPDPPPNVDFSKLEVPDPSLKTMRERLQVHQSNPVCAGCHKITDPIGLALENFDGASSYRTTEGGAPINTSGELDAAKYPDVVGLANAMRNNPRVTSCLTERVASYALGRPMSHDDDAWLKYVGDRFADSGYRVRELMRTIATSKGFYAVTNDSNVPTGGKS